MNPTPQFTEREEQAIRELGDKQGLSREAVLRQGLRMYQLVVAGTHKLVELNPQPLAPVSGEAAAPRFMNDLVDWLDEEAETVMKQAIARRGTADVMRGATAKELRDAKKMAEQMAGRPLNLASDTVKQAREDARMYDSISAKLEKKARQLSAWADTLRAIQPQAESDQPSGEVAARQPGLDIIDKFLDDHCGDADVFVGDQCLGYSIPAVRTLMKRFAAQDKPHKGKR
jgi:hypothetical protein